MVEITNEITKKFINDKIKELVNYDLPLTSLRNIDSFLNGDIDLIKESLSERLNQIKKDLYVKTEKIINDNYSTISNLNNRMKDYEEDLSTLEKLKAFKRKSKFLN